MLKTKTITTDKATLLVVEMPEGAYCPNICQLPPSIGVNYFLYENGVNTPYKESLDIPKGNWQLLGRLPDITEEQTDKIVDESIHSGLYTHYVKEVNPPNVYIYGSSRDSLSSLLQANEVYFDNPIPPFKERFEDFKEAQSKVWDKERCYIFIKVD